MRRPLSSRRGRRTTGPQRAGARPTRVVNQLFENNGSGNTWTDQGCDTSKPAAPVCAYSYEGGGAFLTVEGSDAAGWKVTKLSYVAD